jgi:hypothetical protein
VERSQSGDAEAEEWGQFGNPGEMNCPPLKLVTRSPVKTATTVVEFAAVLVRVFS